MGTVNKFGVAKLLDPTHRDLDGQARVNAEIFTAMEILGRKLERVEDERDRLARRLALIESAATVDEKTGKLYLPVVMDTVLPMRAVDHATPKWIASASLMSSAIALFALGLVLFREAPPALTKEQLAILDSMKGPQFAMLAPESKGWKHLETEEPQESVNPAPAVAEQSLPLVAESPKPEIAAAEPPAPPVETPVVAAVPVEPIPLVKPAETKVAAEEPKPTPAPELKAVEKKEDPAPVTAVAAAETSRIPPDPALPEKLAQLEKRAYQGVPEAQHDMATLYASGKMVPQNYKRSIYWFTQAADNGVANAHYNLGVIYHQGLGVKADMQRALGWYEKAAELGHPEAMYNLGIAYIEGIGTKTDIAKGVSYFKRAANAGVAQAAYNLGVLYESNFIGAIDKDKAIEWYQMAVNEGHTEAHTAIDRLRGAIATNDQALTLAEMAEPAAGDEEIGEGDSSPADEGRNNLLAQIQQELIRQGLLPDEATGVMTPQTEDAIRAYQKKLSLTADGQPSRELLDKILKAGASGNN